MSIVDRSLPGCIIVNKKGKRFANEAAPYIDVVKSQYANHFKNGGCYPGLFHHGSPLPQQVSCRPMMPMSTPKKFTASGYLKVADTSGTSG